MGQGKMEHLIIKCFVLLTGGQLLLAGMTIYQLYQAGNGNAVFLLLFFCTICLQSGIGIFLVAKYSKRSWYRLIREMEERLAQKNLRITVEE